MANPVGGAEGHISSNHGPAITVTEFLKDPTIIRDAINDLAPDTFITETLFAGPVAAPGGAVKYRENVSKYVLEAADIDDNSADFAISEGSRFHQVYQEEPAEVIARTRKYGVEGWVTFEEESRNDLPVMQRLTRRITNTMAKYFDKAALNKLATDVNIASLATPTNGSWWLPSYTGIVDDIMEAVDQVEDEATAGTVYNANTLVVSKRTYNMMRRNVALQELFEKPDTNAGDLRFGGAIASLAGIDILYSRWMLDDMAFVLERGGIGTIADEVPFTVKPVERDEAREINIIRAKRLSVAVLTDPKAIVRLTGLTDIA
jgi:hypothetical protein